MSLKMLIELTALGLALAVGATMAWVGIGFAGATPAALLIHSPLILAPLFGIVWVLRGRRKGRVVR